MSIAGYGCLKHGREGYCRECSKIPVKPTYAELEQQLATLREAATDEVELIKAMTPKGKALPVATHKLAALLKEQDKAGST